MPELPGKLFFECQRLHARLSVNACVDRWKSANNNKAKNHCGSCTGCIQGATHAGVAIKWLSRWYRKPICNRCHRPSERLIRGEVCPSCYNRGSEFLRGYNAKGTPPLKLLKMGGLAPRRVLCRMENEVREIASGMTVDMTEVVMGILRSQQGTVAFAFDGPKPVLGECSNGR